MKLGQVALIAFIVLAVIIVAFLLMMCCMYCPTLFGGRNQGYENQQNYYPNNIGMQKQWNTNYRNKCNILKITFCAFFVIQLWVAVPNIKCKNRIRNGPKMKTLLLLPFVHHQEPKHLVEDFENTKLVFYLHHQLIKWSEYDCLGTILKKSLAHCSLEWLKPYQFSTSIGETDVKRPTTYQYHHPPESKRSHLDVKINRPVTSVVQYENPPTSSESDQLERSVPDYEVPSNRFTISSPVIRSSNGLPPAATGYGSSRPPNSSLPPPPPMHFGQNEAMRSYSQINTRSITTNSKLI